MNRPGVACADPTCLWGCVPADDQDVVDGRVVPCGQCYQLVPLAALVASLCPTCRRGGEPL